MPSITDQIRAFLRENFPGGTIDDEYYFVSVRSSAQRRLKHEGLQPAVAKLCVDACWLVAVNVEGISDLDTIEIESRSITYKPEWDIEEHYTQWVARLRGELDINRLTCSTTAPSALALVSPSFRIVLDVSHARVTARSSDELSAFLTGLEALLEPVPAGEL